MAEVPNNMVIVIDPVKLTVDDVKAIMYGLSLAIMAVQDLKRDCLAVKTRDDEHMHENLRQHEKLCAHQNAMGVALSKLNKGET